MSCQHSPASGAQHTSHTTAAAAPAHEAAGGMQEHSTAQQAQRAQLIMGRLLLRAHGWLHVRVVLAAGGRLALTCHP